jgi:hypothetical protein
MRKATILSNMSHEIVTNEPSLDLQRWLWGPIWRQNKMNTQCYQTEWWCFNCTDRWYSRSCKSRFWETFEKFLQNQDCFVMLQLFEPKILEKTYN